MDSSQIMVSNYTTGDVWPPSDCSLFIPGTPIMPNTTDSRVCGLQSTNRTLIQACCDGAELHQYKCFLYCGYTGKGSDFANCIANQTGSSTSTRRTDLFCQSNVTLRDTATLTSFAIKKYSTLRVSWLVMAVLFAILFVGPTSATIIHSLDGGKTLARRQNANIDCSFSPDQHFTRTGRQSVALTGQLDCANCADDSVGIYGLPIDTGIDHNNRTLNGNSAADPEYDQIFGIVSNSTSGRLFPAQSSVSLYYEPLIAATSTFFLSWTPVHWCVNGTVTNCDGVLGDIDNATSIEACGPVFVGDVTDLADTGATIQGVIATVTTN